MFSIRKISPMVRAVGTVGAVAAIAGGITFANLTSNTVALTNNQLTSATAALAIAAGTNCNSEGGVGDTSSIQGFSNVKLTPGVASSPFKFCLDNTGDIPLAITASISNPTGGSLDASKVTLNLSCDGNTVITQTLTDLYGAAQTFGPNDLSNGHSWNCTATAELDAGYAGSGGQSVTPFDINFVGNQV